MITYADLLQWGLFYAVYAGIPLLAIIMSIVFAVMHKKTVRLGIANIEVKDNMFTRAMRWCSVIVPVIFLAAEIMFLIKQSNMSATYLGRAFTDNVAAYILYRVVYAILFGIMFMMFRLVYIWRKKLEEFKKRQIIEEHLGKKEKNG